MALTVDEAGNNFDQETQSVSENSTEYADFSGLIDAETEEQLNQTSRKIKEAFVNVDVRDFTAFSTNDSIPKTGVYLFSIDQKFLQEASYVCNLTGSVGKQLIGSVKITIFKDTVKFAVFNQSAFSEIIIPQQNPVDGDFNNENPPAFIFDLGILAKIAKYFADSIIVFEFNAEKQLLIVSSGQTHLEFTTFCEMDFAEFHSKLGEPKYIKEVQTDIYKNALKYSSLFCKKDDTQQHLSIVESTGNYLASGYYASIGLYSSPLVDTFGFKAKFEVLGALGKIFDNLNKDNSHLWETENYYLLRDENLYFGFEKPNVSFPPIDTILKSDTSCDSILVMRSQLLNSLYKLSCVSLDKDLLVNVKISGRGNEATLKLSVEDAYGKVSKDSLSVTRVANEGKVSEFEDQEAFLNINALIKILSHFQTVNSRIKLVSKITYVIDEDESFNATTAMIILNQDQVNKMKSKKEEEK